MRTTDVTALGEVAAEGLGVLTTAVRGMHSGISGRVFSVIGPGGRPVQAVHDTVAAGIYDAVATAGRRIPAAAGAFASGFAFDDDPPLDERSSRSGALIAALNGIYGDELAERENAFATELGFRVAGRRVAPTPEALADAYPDATGHLVVFVHGLCNSEASWSRSPRDPDAGDPRRYGDRLVDDLRATPLYLRYNTGRHVSENGRDLDLALDALVRAWPVPVRRISLVGHSMGGLVARSACHYGDRADRPWSRLVRQVVCLGSPNLGSEVEKTVNVAAWMLARLRETRAVAEFLNLRSDGIKDLRYGACLDEDWQSSDPDELLRDRCGEFLFLPHARYHFVATSIAPGVLGAVFGDHLVRSRSASGRGRTRVVPFEAAHGLVLTGFHHMDLLNHPEVYDRLLVWLTPEATAALPAGQG